eukprot:COSAG02_NODE_2218_length_9474_cov_25.098453_5_plen_71_part_00
MIECTIGGSTTGRDGVRVGTMGRNHIRAVHVLRLHRAIHTIHVTTILFIELHLLLHVLTLHSLAGEQGVI